MLLLDVTPHSLGIMVAGGYFHRLIDRNTTVPTSKSHVFTTVRDDQTSVKIVVFQGESDRAEENELLGEFVLSGLRKAPKGDVEVEVTFEISADGIVGVAARDTETGTEQHITVTATSGLTEAEIERMANENQEFLVSSRAEEEVGEGAPAYREAGARSRVASAQGGGGALRDSLRARQPGQCAPDSRRCARCG